MEEIKDAMEVTYPLLIPILNQKVVNLKPVIHMQLLTKIANIVLKTLFLNQKDLLKFLLIMENNWLLLLLNNQFQSVSKLILMSSNSTKVEFLIVLIVEQILTIVLPMLVIAVQAHKIIGSSKTLGELLGELMVTAGF